MIELLSIGILLGLSAGFAPGPLLALVISETLQHDIKAGVKVAVAPLVTDLPIVVLSVFILSRLSHFHGLLGVISLAGSLLVFHMGIANLRLTGFEPRAQESGSDSFKRGVLANALSPHPYLFWISVGAPTMTRAMDVSVLAAFAFIFGFYSLLVGSKVLLALLAGSSKSLLTGRLYVNSMRFLGLLLCGLALALLRDGLRLLAFV